MCVPGSPPGLPNLNWSPSKSDQVPDLGEKAYLHEFIQVPELNETYLCEGKLRNKNDVSHLRILSNMTEEETHVDNTSFGKQEDICQTLFDIVQDQSDVHRRAVSFTALLCTSDWSDLEGCLQPSSIPSRFVSQGVSVTWWGRELNDAS